MFCMYILQSLKDNRFYIGHTNNLSKRLERHNRRLVRSTKHRKPFRLVYKEDFETKQQAYKRELQGQKYERVESNLRSCSNGLMATAKRGSRSAGIGRWFLATSNRVPPTTLCSGVLRYWYDSFFRLHYLEESPCLPAFGGLTD